MVYHTAYLRNERGEPQYFLKYFYILNINRSESDLRSCEVT